MRKISNSSKRILEHASNGVIKPRNVFEEDERTMTTMNGKRLLGRGGEFWTVITAARRKEAETLETSGMMMAFGVSVELEKRMRTSLPNSRTICAISSRMTTKMKTCRWAKLRGRSDWSRNARKQRVSGRRVDVLKWPV
jgi:hypothetical protein